MGKRGPNWQKRYKRRMEALPEKVVKANAEYDRLHGGARTIRKTCPWSVPEAIVWIENGIARMATDRGFDALFEHDATVAEIAGWIAAFYRRCRYNPVFLSARWGEIAARLETRLGLDPREADRLDALPELPEVVARMEAIKAVYGEYNRVLCQPTPPRPKRRQRHAGNRTPAKVAVKAANTEATGGEAAPWEDGR